MLPQDVLEVSHIERPATRADEPINVFAILASPRPERDRDRMLRREHARRRIAHAHCDRAGDGLLVERVAGRHEVEEQTPDADELTLRRSSVRDEIVPDGGLASVLRPSEQRLALMRPVSLAGLFAALCGTVAGAINVLRLIWTSEGPVNWAIVAVGSAESLVPLLLAFGCLTVAWLSVAAGFRRQV